jgi:hypothetical protein
MEWTAPSFEVLKMDAEIGSYQEDREPERESLAAPGPTGPTGVSVSTPRND